MATPATVRIAEPADAQVLGGLLFDFNTEFESPTPDAATFARRFRKLLERSDLFAMLAERDGTAVGFALVTLRPTPYTEGPLAQLEELYVQPELRDAGIGTALLTEVIGIVRERGAEEMHIAVDEVDVDTRRFYERHGFSNMEPGEDYRMLLYLRQF